VVDVVNPPDTTADVGVVPDAADTTDSNDVDVAQTDAPTTNDAPDTNDISDTAVADVADVSGETTTQDSTPDTIAEVTSDITVTDADTQDLATDGGGATDSAPDAEVDETTPDAQDATTESETEIVGSDAGEDVGIIRTDWENNAKTAKADHSAAHHPKHVPELMLSRCNV
jgi:hypothetical protein